MRGGPNFLLTRFSDAEHTRAYRFVYPTLLVASLERAFLWNIHTGEMVQALAEIQSVLPFGAGQGSSHTHPTPLASSQSDHAPLGEPIGTEHNLLDAGLLPPADGHEAPHPANQIDWLFEADLEVEDEEDLEFLPEFLGPIHYVELSERHVIIVGRYLLRVFSRDTGKPVLDVPSTMFRYGAVKWEVRSQKWAEEETIRGKGKGVADDYRQAMKERREGGAYAARAHV